MHRTSRPGGPRLDRLAVAFRDAYLFPWQDLARRDEFRGRAAGGAA